MFWKVASAREWDFTVQWSVGTAQFCTLEAGAGPANNLRVGYFGGSQFHNGFAAVRILFYFASSQRKLPIVISLIRVCASCALNVSAALQGAYKKRWCILHYTAVTKQWTKEWPYIANNKTIRTWRKSYSELVLMCYFPNCTKTWWIKLLSSILGWAIAPLKPQLLSGSIGSKNALFLAAMLLFHTCFFHARNKLGTPRGAMIFLRGVKNVWTMSNSFKFCPTRFSTGDEKFSKCGTSPPAPLATVLASLHIVQTRGEQTCSMEESFEENQKHRRAAKPVCSVNTNTVKNASFTLKWYIVIVNMKFLCDFLVPENLDNTLLDVRINSPKCSFFRVAQWFDCTNFITEKQNS